MFKKIILNNIQMFTGNDYSNQYNELNRLDSNDDLLNFQEDHLNALLFHSYENVPYYYDIFKKNVKNKNIDVSIFNEIPIINKDIIKQKEIKLISNDIKSRKYYYNTSGGSTGEPVKFIQDNLYFKWRSATNYYYYKNILKIDEPRVKEVILWGSEKDLFNGRIPIKNKMFNWLTNKVFLNSFKMKQEDIKKYIEKINSYKPDLIRGYAGSLYELSKYAEKNNLRVHKPKIIVSAAEMLQKNMREKIENIFQTKVYDFYGSREISSIAGECEHGSMHLFSFWNMVEILKKNNKPAKEGQEGRVIVTNLFNYSMPLIRYELGDTAIVGKKCKCGNILPTLKSITGRVIDHFLLRDGTVIPAEYFIHLIGVVYNKGTIKQFQIIQEDYNEIRILAALSKSMSNSEQDNINNKIRLVMGNKCKVTWEFVDTIPKTKTGKYIYTKSLVVK